jgi:hypothetical protein
VFSSLGRNLIDTQPLSLCLTLLCAAASTLGVPFLFSFAVIVMALVTLRQGPLAGALLCLCTALPGLLWVMFQPSYALYLSHNVLLGSFSVWCLASVLCVTRSWRQVLLLGSLLFAVLLVVLAKSQLFVQLARLSIATSDSLLQSIGTSIGDQQDIHLLHAWMLKVMLMPGTWVFVFALQAYVYLFIARAWQSSICHPGGARHELLQIRMGWVAVLLFMGLLVMAFMGFPLASNILIVFSLPFIINGLILIHVFSGRFARHAAFILIGFYVMMLLLMHIMVFCLLCAGLADSVLDFRNMQRRGT